MKKFVRGRGQKAGMPPGSLIHIGERKKDTTNITVYCYNEGSFQEHKLNSIDEYFRLNEDNKIKWINVEGIHDIAVLEKIGNAFGLHSLVMEDILNTEQRPKIEDYIDYEYIVAKMLYYDTKNRDYIIEQVSLVLGKDFVISFQEKGEDVFGPVRERLKSGAGRIRKQGADYLAYSLLDSIVDNYFIVLEELGEDIERIEDSLLIKPTSKTLQQVHTLRRELLFIHRSIWPLREVLGTMGRGELPLVNEETEVYLRDVYDHIVQSMDTTETYRDILSGMIDIYLSSTSNRMNEIMKVLTVFSTIFMPLTFIVGIYGMNFKYMPELDWNWGYPAVLILMTVIGVSMFIYFKRKKWV